MLAHSQKAFRGENPLREYCAEGPDFWRNANPLEAVGEEPLKQEADLFHRLIIDDQTRDALT